MANAYYNKQDFILAKHYFSEFYRTFGNHQWAEEAEFLSAYCDYKMSPRPSLDQSYTRKAISAFELFIRRNPNSPRVKKANDLIIELRNKLAIKAYEAAKLYYEMEDYKAAIIALNNCLKRYPNTEHREEVRFLILKSNFLLASNSIKEKEQERFQSTLDEYYTFVNQFPESQYQEEVEKIFEKTQRNLKN
jgi:outer membrane protein assembly factor BamD